MPRPRRRPATSAEAQGAPWGVVALHSLPMAVAAVLLALAFATVTACTPGSFIDDGELSDPGATEGDDGDALVSHGPLDLGLELPGPGPQRLDPVPIDAVADRILSGQMVLYGDEKCWIRSIVTGIWNPPPLQWQYELPEKVEEWAVAEGIIPPSPTMRAAAALDRWQLGGSGDQFFVGG